MVRRRGKVTSLRHACGAETEEASRAKRLQTSAMSLLAMHVKSLPRSDTCAFFSKKNALDLVSLLKELRCLL